MSVVNNPDAPCKKTMDTYPDSIERMRGQVAVCIPSGANDLIYWLYSDWKRNPRRGNYTVFNTKKRPEFTRMLKAVKISALYFNGFTHGAQLNRKGNLGHGFKKVEERSILILVNVSKQPLSGKLELPVDFPAVLYQDNETPVQTENGMLDYSLPAEGQIFVSKILQEL